MIKSILTSADYTEALPVAARDALTAVAPDAPVNETFPAIHSALADKSEKIQPDNDVSLQSVKRRVAATWPDAVGSGGSQFCEDELGRTTLRAAPPHNRLSMYPEEWRTNPLARFWDRLRGRKVVHRYATSELQRQEDHWRQTGTIRRYILLILTLAQTAVATWYMKTILPYRGWTLIDPVGMWHQNWHYTFLQLLPYLLQTGILVLFAILFCWVSAGFWTALMGFIQLIIGKDRYSISYKTVDNSVLNPAHRTALIMPICNEDVERVFAGLRATWESVLRTGESANFDVYILSDSYDADIVIAEQKAWMELIRDVKGEGHIFYRRRRRRVKRKSGNIDDFCRRWGSQYSYMVVLDADSVMSGECLTSLVRMMEAHPTAGIIQSSPKASGMETLYARCQQFATRVYGPLFTAGLHFWQLGESHYWGHNAIIRVKPFIEHCALAPLPGQGSFTGSILSHDFVEAALMRRAGWGVWIAYDLPGSYEELPPNLLDELKRDRRWCHGNLMNFRLFLVKGMHPVHRAVFLTGVMSYLSAPLWFLFLLLSTALQIVHKLMEPQYFMQPRQLYPVWTQWRPELAIMLFSTTLLLLFLPKLLSVILLWFRGSKPFGGPLRLFLSLLVEMLFSVLLAPVRMLFHTIFVVSAFLDKEVVWNSPQRDDGATSWREAFHRHGPQQLLGLIWAVGMGWQDLNFLWWLSPIVFSLILSPFVSVISSRSTFGIAAKRHKLFLIPEEYMPPQELVDTDRYLEMNRKRALKGGFIYALIHPSFNALASAMATGRHRKSDLIDEARMQTVEQTMEQSPYKISREHRLLLVSDPVLLGRIHTRLWRNAGQHHVWFDYYDKMRQLNPCVLNYA